jgi:hypothetical protein
MFIKLKSLLLSLIVFAGTPLISEAANLADYIPLGLGSYWTYQNAANSNDTYTVSVFEEFVFSGFNGQPAVKFGTDSNNYSIGYNNGTCVNIYASTKNGIPSVSIGNFTDGTFFNLIEPTNFVLLRMYDNLNPTLKSVYGVNDPNLVLWVTYDSKYPKNSQNSIVESNLGITIPNYAVTHLEWYAKDVGEIVKLDVDAGTGAIGTRYELIAHSIVAGQFGSFDGKKNVKLTLKDCNNNDVMFMLAGAGYGEIDRCDCTFSSITLFETTEKSSFTIQTKGKIQTSVGDIVVNGSLKRIMATTTDLRGDISVTGGLGMLVLDDVADGHTITIGPSTNPNIGVIMKFDQVGDLTINSKIPIKMLSATEWLGGSLNAPSVGSITTKGDKKRGIPGDLDVNITLDGSISSAKVAGILSGEWTCVSAKNVSAMDIAEAKLTLRQKPDAKIMALYKLTAKGWIDCTRILSMGNIGTISAGGIGDSSCFAGVTDTIDQDEDGVLDLPDPAVHIDYDEPATIKKISVKGIKGEQYCLINSNIAAANILSASIVYPKKDNSGQPFGFAADLIKALKIKDETGTESWKNLDKPTDSKEFGDAKVLLH